MHRVPAFALLILIIISGFPLGLRAQSTNASLTGRITDPSKAVIADAKIAAINAGTSFRYESTTNSSGEYYMPNLPPGPYRLEVEKTGFKKLIKPRVILHVQDALAIDFEMAVGDITESITAQAGAPLLNTESANVSTVVDRTFVQDLPLNGRSFQTLIMLTPGVVVAATAFDDQGQFSVNGSPRMPTISPWTASAPISASRVTFRSSRPLEEHWPRLAFRAGRTAWCPSTPCRSFASKRLRSLRSSGALPVGKSRL